MAVDELVTVGLIGRPRGLRGTCRFVPVGLPGDRLTGLERLVLEARDGQRREYAVRRWNQQGVVVWVDLEGVADRTAAEALRGQYAVLPRGELPPLAEDEYYTSDLTGLAVENTVGEGRGRVVAVEAGAAHDLLVIERDGRRARVPAVKAFVREVDTAGGRIVIEEVEGLWE